MDEKPTHSHMHLVGMGIVHINKYIGMHRACRLLFINYIIISILAGTINIASMHAL